MKNYVYELEVMRTIINRNFLIRICPDGAPKKRRSMLVSLPTLGVFIGPMRAYHIAQKALTSKATHPTFRAKGATIVFYWR